MTGFNHYPDCTCGWCVSKRWQFFDKEQLRSAMRVRDASKLLERNLANSLTACFVNPNARCPVCSRPVFFYANEFGSRVYFDDLGPPWPKHPCTDNPKIKSVKNTSIFKKITLRSEGLTRELLRAAAISDYISKPIKDSSENIGWILLVVNFVKRIDNKNSVNCEYIGNYDGKLMEFTCFSNDSLFEVGDLISKKGEKISFIDKNNLNIINFNIGSEIKIENQVKSEIPIKDISNINLPKIRKKKILSVVDKKSSFDRHQMVEAEKVHFHTGDVHVANFCKNLEPVVKRYARSGIRKPIDVSKKLNEDGYKTACNSYWTPRITHFLLKLIFSDNRPYLDIKKSLSDTKITTSKLKTEGDSLTHEELVSRLEKFGRVVVNNKN